MNNKNSEEVLRQNLKEKGKFQNVYFIYLLFEQAGIAPSTESLKEKLAESFGEIDVVSQHTFSIKKHPVAYQDGKVPAQVMITDFIPIKEGLVSDLERTQQWDCPEWEEIVNKCQSQLIISDFLASGLPYKQRTELLTRWVEIVLELMPECKGIWVPASGKFLTRQQVLENPYEKESAFLYFGMNVRFFNIQDTPDSLVDTLGLYAIGLPDLQYHFHDLSPNAVVNHAYNVADYLFSNEVEIKSGETISGITNDEMDADVKWVCQYEESLIQPAREVLDICPGEFAAGNRE